VFAVFTSFAGAIPQVELLVVTQLPSTEQHSLIAFLNDIDRMVGKGMRNPSKQSIGDDWSNSNS